MKSTGIVRKLDELGRVTVPKELRRTLRIEEGESLEIFMNGEEIILRKYNPGCNCCKNIEIEATVQGIDLCSDCILKFKKALKVIAGVRTNG